MIIKIEVASNEKKLKYGTILHEKLRGHDDYIDSNIILNIDGENTILIDIGDLCQRNTIASCISDAFSEVLNADI